METNNQSVFAPVVRKFLESVAQKTIDGERYSERIELKDGGYNSYIGLCVDADDYNKLKRPRTYGIRIFRHSNTVDIIKNCWEFDLGDIVNPLCENKNIPLCFRTYGTSLDSAEQEAEKHFAQLMKQIEKRTSEKKVAAAESAAKEKELLLARLKELGD